MTAAKPEIQSTKLYVLRRTVYHLNTTFLFSFISFI